MQSPRNAATILLIIAATCALGAWLLWHPYFVDPDSFYHIGVSRLMRETRSLVIHFDALPLTTLEDSFADQAWLYHLLLIPFLTLVGDAGGIKVFAVLNAALVMVSIYGIARKWRAPSPWVYPLVLLLTAPFVFRLILGKPSALAVLILIWGIFALIEKQYWLLALLSAALVWTHGSWPLIVGICALAALRQREWRSILAPFAGTALGLTLNPYFPANLFFFWQQTALIGLIGFHDTIGVGREWYPYPLADFIADNALLLSLALVSALVVLRRRDRTTAMLILAIPVLTLIVLTLHANRNIEFLTPVLTLFAASACAAYRDSPLPFTTRLSLHRIAVAAAAILVLVSTAQVIQLRSLLARGYHRDPIVKVSAWLKHNVAPNTLVINTRWEDFPALWYRNPQLRFVVGLDPAFLFLQAPDTYRAWQDLTRGVFPDDPHKIREVFHGDIIVVKKEFQALHDRLMASSAWMPAYEGKEAWIMAPRAVSAGPAP